MLGPVREENLLKTPPHRKEPVVPSFWMPLAMRGLRLSRGRIATWLVAGSPETSRVLQVGWVKEHLT